MNERPVEVDPGATAADAVRTLDPLLGERVAAGQARITDGRGIEVGAGEPVAAGSIFRVISAGRAGQAASPDADA